MSDSLSYQDSKGNTTNSDVEDREPRPENNGRKEI